jgi:glyoxylase-like metal-dependent hydrolase (beta-lactamase superfamily II)
MSDTNPEPALVHDRTVLRSNGVADALSPLVRRLIAPNPGPFTFTGTCSYIIGRGRVTIVDPGPDNDEHLAALLRAVEGETVDAIAITHTHVDHSPLTAKLKAATGAKIIGCAAHVEIRNDASGRLDASHDLAYAPDAEMRDGDIFEGAGYSLTAIATPGHASNHLCFAIAEDDSLLCGDHVMAWSTTIVAPPDGQMSDYMTSLDKLAKRSERVFHPGHGATVADPQRYCRALAHHRRQREHSILNALAAHEDTIAGLVERIYVGLDDRLKKAAALSVLAHMEDLVARGLADAGGAATLDAHYRRT